MAPSRLQTKRATFSRLILNSCELEVIDIARGNWLLRQLHHEMIAALSNTFFRGLHSLHILCSYGRSFSEVLFVFLCAIAQRNTFLFWVLESWFFFELDTGPPCVDLQHFLGVKPRDKAKIDVFGSLKNGASPSFEPQASRKNTQNPLSCVATASAGWSSGGRVTCPPPGCFLTACAMLWMPLRSAVKGVWFPGNGFFWGIWRILMDEGVKNKGGFPIVTIWALWQFCYITLLKLRCVAQEGQKNCSFVQLRKRNQFKPTGSLLCQLVWGWKINFVKTWCYCVSCFYGAGPSPWTIAQSDFFAWLRKGTIQVVHLRQWSKINSIFFETWTARITKAEGGHSVHEVDGISKSENKCTA